MKIGIIAHPTVHTDEPFTIKCDITKFQAYLDTDPIFVKNPKIFDTFEDAYIFLRVKRGADRVQSFIQNVSPELARKAWKLKQKAFKKSNRK